jgi:hypothetical protein
MFETVAPGSLAEAPGRSSNRTVSARSPSGDSAASSTVAWYRPGRSPIR